MKECVQPYYIKDGSLLDCSSFQTGLIDEGKSIYEVARLSGPNLLFLDDHINRLFKSLELEGLESHISPKEIRSHLENLLRKNQVREGNVKFVLNFRPPEKPRFLAYFVSHCYPSKNDYKNGVKTITFYFERQDPNKKVWRPEFRRDVAEEIRKKAVFEALLLDSQGSLPEASKSNIFGIRNNTVITPPDELVLPGITRKYVLKACRELGIKVLKRKILLEELEELDGLFLTGTSIQVLPVCQVNELELQVENTNMLKIMNQYISTINNYTT